MQSIFRLPWSPGALDKPATYTAVDLPTANANKGKRKRMMDSSPRSSPNPKKVKAVDGGAVQGPPNEFISAGDSSPALQPALLPTTAVNGNRKIAAVRASGLSTSVRKDDLLPNMANATIATYGSFAAPVRAPAHLPPQLAPEPVLSTTAQLPWPSQSPPAQEVSAPQQPQARKPHSSLPVKAKMAITTDLLREVVVRQVDAAIVHKHHEMSLIDQQIAKCQIALEQIRRCQLIPFPGSRGPSLAVASHSGPALVTPAGLSVPSSPAPWGVVDGPYTRHYAKWLIPSPSFDAQVPQSAGAVPSPFHKDTRATRGSGMDLTPLNMSSARSSRNSSGRARSMFDPHSPTAARDPLVIKRTQDGEMVKLYCSHCAPERSDFANVQGFLNHCRISHRLEFKSHEEAAIKCGRVVKPTDGMKMPEAPTPRDVVPKSVPTIFSSDRPLVNPLNKNTLKERLPLQQLIPRTYSTETPSRVKLPSTDMALSTFVPSPQTPHLSSLLQKRAFGGNLAAIVTDVKQKVDLSVYDDSDSELDVHSTKRSKSSKKNGPVSTRAVNKKTTSAGLVNTAQSLGRSKPMSMGSSRTAGVQLPPIRPPTKTDSVTGSPAATDDLGLSPHTADSNPGLVSDRDDDDDVDEEDSPSEHQRGGHHGEMDPDVMMIDIEDSDVEGRSNDRHSQGFCNRNGQGNTGIGC